ncbi:hypothetical protein LEP1GSC018_4053 [Leptospira kirschneri str. 2008720114]|nr:hypothetical protein LEP1GSC018_4053 [Leptospira kirschneri str. 2008720114]
MVQYAIWRFSVQDFYSFFLLTPNSRYLWKNQVFIKRISYVPAHVKIAKRLFLWELTRFIKKFSCKTIGELPQITFF